MDPRSLEDMASHTMEIDSVDDYTAVQRMPTSSTSLALPRVSFDSITPDQPLQSFIDNCCDWTRVCLGNGNSVLSAMQKYIVSAKLQANGSMDGMHAAS